MYSNRAERSKWVGCLPILVMPSQTIHLDNVLSRVEYFYRRRLTMARNPKFPADIQTVAQQSYH